MTTEAENWCRAHREPADTCTVCAILRADKAKAAQMQSASAAQRMAAVSVGVRYEAKQWADFHPPCNDAAVTLGIVRDYAVDFGRHRAEGTTLFLLGNPGTGKNLLAACLCRDIVEHGHTALHTTAAKMVRRIRESWRRDGEGEQAALDIFTTPDALVVDEVGVQKGTDDEAIRLFDVINERYLAMKPTIIISNLNVQDLGRYLTVRTMERLLENHILAPFTWQSYRRRPQLAAVAKKL